MSFLKRLFSRTPSPQVHPFTAPVAPDTPFHVIGDVHGRLDLLERLITKIESDGFAPDLVFVGDYIDRGEDSAGVLRFVHELCQRDDLRVTCLQGNHEDMLLKFLEDPAERGARWLRYGGLQALSSFGVGGISDGSSPAAMVNARDALRDAMGPDLIDWLSGLDIRWHNGNVAVVHAAADPAVAMADQEPRTLKWGHRDFMSVPRSDDVWVVHGHTIVDQPTQEDGRIAVDTGAFATGRLTAAYIEPGNVSFLQA